MAGSVANLTTLGRAAVYFYCRGDEKLAGAIIDRLVHESRLRDAARENGVCRQRLGRRTGEFIDLMKVFCDVNEIDPAEAFVCGTEGE